MRSAVSSPASVSRNQSKAQRKKPDEMATIVEDLIRLLDDVGESYRHGRHPESRTAKPTAKLLRALADELDLEGVAGFPAGRGNPRLTGAAMPVTQQFCPSTRPVRRTAGPFAALRRAA